MSHDSSRDIRNSKSGNSGIGDKGRCMMAVRRNR